MIYNAPTIKVESRDKEGLNLKPSSTPKLGSVNLKFYEGTRNLLWDYLGVRMVNVFDTSNDDITLAHRGADFTNDYWINTYFTNGGYTLYLLVLSEWLKDQTHPSKIFPSEIINATINPIRDIKTVNGIG